jgi:predicted metal-binding protein
MTGEQKLEAVARQITGIGKVSVILCPYCGEESINGQVFCCETLLDAVSAILQREAQQELIDKAARIADAVASN